MKIDGSGIMDIGSSDDYKVNSISMEKEWIYYSCYTTHLCRVCIDDTKAAKIYTSKAGESINSHAYYDGWAYYIIFHHGKERNDLWEIRVDGTENQRILEDFHIFCMNIVNGWLYYSKYRSRELYYYRMRLDGTNKQEVNIKILRQEIENVKK